MTLTLEQGLEHFLKNLDTEALLTNLSDDEKLNSLEVLATFKNEATVALSLITDELRRDHRVLEVGSGLCLLSIFLKSKGYEIIALEPLAGGFSFFDKLKQNILDAHANIELTVLNKTAEQLTQTVDGKFDLIFSNNVIEHIPNLDEAFNKMHSVLKHNGKMIHGCPNYVIPYEPHFGIPVIHRLPMLSKFIWRKKIQKNRSVWESLNFVTYFKIKKLAHKLDCSLNFQPHITYNTFKRFRNDNEFLTRHQKSMVGKCFNFLEKSGTLKLTKLLPAWCSTPMVFSMKNKNHDQIN